MIFSALIPKVFNAKVLLDIHDIGPELFMRKLNISENSLAIKLLKFIEKISIKFSDHVIVVSDLWKKKLAKRSVSPDKCSVILNVPYDEHIYLRTTTLYEKKTLDIYYPGSLEEHFGVDTLIEAMPMVKDEVPNTMLHIYSGKKGRMLDYLKKRIIDLGIENYIDFNDYVPFTELPEILKNADIGVVPTKGGIFSDEAVSMKSLEFMSLGIPIVISRTKAHFYYYSTDMVRFFEPSNAKDLAEALISLLKSPTQRQKLVENSTVFINKYSWQKSTKMTYIDIIRKLTTDISNG